MATVDLADPSSYLSMNLFDTIIQNLNPVMYSFIFLTICYVYQENCRSPSGASLYQNCQSYMLFTYMQLFGEIWGKQLHCSYDTKSFRNQIREPSLKFFFQCDIEVYYDDFNELKRDKDLYQTSYTNIRFYHGSPPERILTKNDFWLEFNEPSRTKFKNLPINDLVHNSTLNQDHVERFISCSLCFERVILYAIFEE